MSGCTLCPRQCNVLRETASGFCKSGAQLRVARADLHMWEEPPISGQNGSGTVFFTGCPLRCVYCQNHEISAGETLGKCMSPKELSGLFFSLIERGAHNINLVTGTHFVPLLREALLVEKLPVPVVYNTSGYEKPETLRLLSGLVDIYLPDFKYAQKELAEKLSHAEDYPLVAVEAIAEMLRQVGPADCGQPLLTRGVLIRHLILPGHTKNSIEVLRLLHQRFPGVPVSLMAQYTPCVPSEAFPELNRPITRRELQKVEAVLCSLDMDGFVQSRESEGAHYVPDFHQFDEI